MSSPTHARIAGHIESAFRQAVNGLTGKEFTVSAVDTPAAAPALEDPILWQQSISVLEAPALWIAAGRNLWEALARTTLEAAGIDPIAEEDTRSTWQEIVGQTIGGITSALTGDLLCEVSSTTGSITPAEPVDAVWVWFSVSDGEFGPVLFRAAWSHDLTALYEPKVADQTTRPGMESVSKTFDILLDVALPVSVSFGRTALQIREVLKLNTGSIVELNRLVTDPVDVIVNDCVIARGEVVVVDGNYGVRIKQLATREDRLRTGVAEAHRTGAKL